MASGYYILDRAISELIIGAAITVSDGASEIERNGVYKALSEAADVGKFTFINIKMNLFGEVSFLIPISVVREPHSVAMSCVISDGDVMNRISIIATKDDPNTLHIIKHTDRG